MVISRLVFFFSFFSGSLFPKPALHLGNKNELGAGLSDNGTRYRWL